LQLTPGPSFEGAEKRCLAATQKAALALLEQSEDFYRAAKSGVKAAKPLLLYYCFMNLAKAYILAVRQRGDVNDAKHGLSEKLGGAPNNKELLDAYLEAHQTRVQPVPQVTKINVFDDLLRAVSNYGVAASPSRFDLPTLMPQVVPGHRLWAAGAGSHTKERFVSLEKIEFWQGTNAKEIWLRLYLFSDDLKRINLSHQDLLDRTGLNSIVREVVCSDALNERALLCLEQRDSVIYNHRPSDSVPDLVATLRHKLWRTVLATPPYRKYYLYPAPLQELPQVLPQILSIYAITYYLGSITRYRPHDFDVILSSSFGPFIEAFLNDQPAQFIYLMASEFAEKEVTKAAIV
jgi:YaaC-like Protein